MKIPNNAKKVFTGTIYTVYQWEQELFDGSKTTFEAVKRRDTALVIPTSKNKVYVSYEEQPLRPLSHTLFGGQVDNGENPLSTAKRELLEEAGLASNNWSKYLVVEPMTSIDWKIHFFIASDCTKAAEQQLEAGERITVKKLSFEEFIELAASQDFLSIHFSHHICCIRRNPEALIGFRDKLFPL